MMSKLVEIFSSYHLADAICAKSLLDAHEIYSIIQNEHHATMNNLHLIALGGYRLLVVDADAGAAKALLAPPSQHAEKPQPETLTRSGTSVMQNKASLAMFGMGGLFVWIFFNLLFLLPWVFKNIPGGPDSIGAKFFLTAIGLVTIGFVSWWFEKLISKQSIS